MPKTSAVQRRTDGLLGDDWIYGGGGNDHIQGGGGNDDIFPDAQ